MDSQHKKHKSEDLEVTGVSRSGRVRKKSSKLTDFESPDDLDNRHKKSTPRKLSESQDTMLLAKHQSKIYQQKTEQSHFKEESDTLAKEDTDYDNDSYNDLESQNDSSMESSESSEGDDDYDEQEGFKRLDEHTDNENVSQSTYMTGRTNNKKRLVIKDGKIVGDISRKNKRKEKEVPQRQRSSSSISSAATSTYSHVSKGKTTSSAVPSKAVGQATETSKTQSSDVALYKVTGTQPIDVAAHLELLGESLRIIGERLKEHEGQITVSGSLSVLLDSLLCALCPLMCLTQQVPELNSCPPEQLAQTLDNIAYIMPGL